MRDIKFLRRFPVTHKRKGEETFFIEKILLSLLDIGHISMSKAVEIGKTCGLTKLQTIYDLRKLDLPAKHHTIRAGHRWESGDLFSPRYWTGQPYRSKPYEFVHPIEIKKVWDFEVDPCGVPSINGIYLFDTDKTKSIEQCADTRECVVANNDGLSHDDWTEWIIMPCFRKGKSFDGQIICWNDQINYL